MSFPCSFKVPVAALLDLPIMLRFVNALMYQDSETGSNIAVAGVAVQLLGYLLFNAVFLSFWQRVCKDPPPLYHKMRPFFIAVLISSVSIIVRSIFRVVEMAVGWQGVINHTEWTLYVFDGALCWIAVVILIVYSPMKYLPKHFSWRFNPDLDGPPEPDWAMPRPEIRAANEEDPKTGLDLPVASNNSKSSYLSAPENHNLAQTKTENLKELPNVDQSTTLPGPNSNTSDELGSGVQAQNLPSSAYDLEQGMLSTSPTVINGGQNRAPKSTTVQPAENTHMPSESLNYLKTLKEA